MYRVRPKAARVIKGDRETYRVRREEKTMELLHVADAVSREKGIERDEVLEAMEQAIQKAGRAKYGYENDIRAEIDRKTGEVRLQRYLQVADPVENEATQITLKAAPKSKSDVEVRDLIAESLPPSDLG